MILNKIQYIYNFNKQNTNKIYFKILIKFIILGFYKFSQKNKFSEDIIRRCNQKIFFKRIYLKESLKNTFKRIFKRIFKKFL